MTTKRASYGSPFQCLTASYYKKSRIPTDPAPIAHIVATTFILQVQIAFFSDIIRIARNGRLEHLKEINDHI